MMIQRGPGGLELSALGFGAASLGNLFARMSDESALETVAAAWDAGIRYFDTAPYYGLGLSEARLGEALAARPPSTHVLSTKVGRRLLDGPSSPSTGLIDGQWALDRALPWVHDYTRDGVLASLEGSLSRLQRDHVDIVYIHDPDENLDQVERESAPALARLRDDGIISAFGVGTSNWRTALRLLDTTDLDVVMIAGRVTLADRSGLPVLEAAELRGVAVVAAAPFNSGLLATPWPGDDSRFDYAPVTEAVLALARDLADACQRYGVVLPEAAIRYPERLSAVRSVVVGMSSPAEVIADVEAFGRPIPTELWLELDGIHEAHGHVAEERL
jgi:D-threo-aldose 1-dehydrogenase